MSDGYWVISVDRSSGQASTSELFTDGDAAWQRSIELERPETFTTVVSRRSTNKQPPGDKGT